MGPRVSATRTSPPKRQPIAFVLLAHKSPEQVGRLARVLTSEGDAVVLHLDARLGHEDVGRFHAALAGVAQVHHAPRQCSRWASWGLVEAAISGIQVSLEAADPAYVAVLSGQDYPIRPPGDLRRFLDHHDGKSFLSSTPLPEPLLGPDGGLKRVQQLHLPIRGRRVRLPHKRPLPRGIRPFSASQFFVMRAEFGAALMDEIERRPDVAAYFRRSWIPDELFFASVAMSSPLAGSIVHENLWYARWDEGVKHPAVLTVDDMPALREASTGPTSSNGPARVKFFARKFDAAGAPAALDAVDEWLHELRAPSRAQSLDRLLG